MHKNQVRRSGAGTSLQHKTKSSIYRMAKGVDLALAHGKSVGLPRESHSVSRSNGGLERPQGGSSALGQSAENIGAAGETNQE